MKTLVAVAGGTVPFLLFASGLFFLFRLRGFYLLHPVKTLRRLGEKGERREALSSLAVALGGTLGVGNITGVTSALSVGGPGALFWMWCSALLSMGLHFAEVVLALDTAAPPGLPRYLSGRITKILFPLSLLFLSLTLGGGLQSAAAAEAAKVALSVPLPVTGALLALPLVFATVGGSRRIRAVSSRVIPFVTLLYALSCLGAGARGRRDARSATAGGVRDRRGGDRHAASLHADRACRPLRGVLRGRRFPAAVGVRGRVRAGRPSFARRGGLPLCFRDGGHVLLLRKNGARRPRGKRERLPFPARALSVSRRVFSARTALLPLRPFPRDPCRSEPRGAIKRGGQNFASVRPCDGYQR